MGRVQFIPASSWHWEGTHDPSSWTVRATCYGPSTSTTWHLPASAVVFVRWGGTPGQPYTGVGPLSWASTTARLQSESERSIAVEAQGPIAQLLAIPQDGGDAGDDDPLASLKADIRAARGKALLVERVNSGWGEGKVAAPQSDWKQQRLGPQCRRLWRSSGAMHGFTSEFGTGSGAEPSPLSADGTASDDAPAPCRTRA